MKELRTEIEFHGTPQEVWEVLTDLGVYAEWNPFIVKIDGEPRTGSKLEVRMEPEGERAMTPPDRARGRAGTRAAMARASRRSRHLRRRAPLADRGSRPRPGAVHAERFGGILVPLLWKKLRDGGTAKGFRAMNEALARRVPERRPPAG
jgi:hypothetical protein